MCLKVTVMQVIYLGSNKRGSSRPRLGRQSAEADGARARRGARQVVTSTRGRELSSDTFSGVTAAQYFAAQPGAHRGRRPARSFASRATFPAPFSLKHK